MKYQRIRAAVYGELWAMEEAKFFAMLEFLEVQFDGGKFTAEEIQARIGKGIERQVAKRDGAVGIIPIHGALVNRASLVADVSAPAAMSTEAIGLEFEAALADKDVKAIVLDINSPGGHVSGTDELSSQIFAARGQKPIIAQVNSNAASAAYWISSAADEIQVTPTGQVGSIGVMAMHDDESEKLKSAGVTRTIISAGKYKAEEFRTLSGSAKDYMQARVDEAYGMFVKAVARNRGVSQTAVREGFGEGRMVPAEAAIKEGMADRIGTMRDALVRFGATAAPAGGARAFAFEREKRALQL